MLVVTCMLQFHLCYLASEARRQHLAGLVYTFFRTLTALQGYCALMDPIGAMGQTGPGGPMRPKGVVGPMRPMGPVGPMGPTGPMGPMGPLGPVVSVGPREPRGLQGSWGPWSPLGTWGPWGPRRRPPFVLMSCQGWLQRRATVGKASRMAQVGSMILSISACDVHSYSVLNNKDTPCLDNPHVVLDLDLYIYIYI